MDGKKVLIFGGQGFLGINIAKFFLRSNKFKVVLVGNKSKNINNIFTKKEKNKILFFENDIYKPKKLINLNLDNSIVIFAAINGGLSNKNFYKKIKIFLNFLKSKNFSKFILLSSISIYGNYSKPLNEHIKVKPINNYARNCLIAEKLSLRIFSENKQNLLILRIAQVFGKFKFKYGVVEKILKYYLTNKKYVFNKKDLIRSYISADELVKIINVLISKKINIDILNIANPNYIFSFSDLISRIEKIIGYKKIFFLKKQPYHIKNSICASTKLQKKYGIKFRNSFKSQITHIIKYFNNNNWA
jgi:UDP-glucose 4-epimerase